jgi:hypothetical protein
VSSPTISVATLPVVRALLDEARHKKYFAGTLGIRARPEWQGADQFEHHGVPVTVVTCVSSLAVREALRQRGEDRWLVILTDRDDADLGAGVRSHLVWHRLRTPDPWNAVLTRFAANGIDPGLTTGAAHRDLATGLLACTPADGGWPPAPGGVLTRDHAFGSVCARHLHVPATALGPVGVLTWMAQPTSVSHVADLRALGGDRLADAVLEWLAAQVGAAAPLLVPILRNGQGRQIVPLGLVLGILVRAGTGSRSDDVVTARVALARLETYTGTGTPPPGAFASWAAQSEQLIADVLRDASTAVLARRLLVEADAVLAEAQAVSLAEDSTLLPAGLTARLGRLASTVQAAAKDATVSPAALAAVESAWLAVSEHVLAVEDARVEAFRAAVRLVRWLAVEDTTPAAELTVLQIRHLHEDAWVDSAVNDAAPGVGDIELSVALSAVLLRVRIRRDHHDAQYARSLAVATQDEVATGKGVVLAENLLQSVVLPLASRTPVLLLIMDGMSAAVGSEIMANVLGRIADGWSEALPEGHSRRLSAVAVLPSVTEVSRASLLCGELRTGDQAVEQKGYAELARAFGLAGARLFHKKPLDSSQLGFAVADDVGAAIDDKEGRPLVTCILNTIDDALDRSDPAGTVWTAETVKHLGPLLDRARVAGRTVVLTSDHGHIVERRQGTQRPHPDCSSNRARAEGPVGDGEVLVTGRRVLLHGGRAILAVDERLRYGPLKAGYHGGAAPAEVVIPVYFLAPGGQMRDTGLVPAPPQEPAWWTGYRPAPVVVAPAPPPDPKAPLTLFDSVEPAIVAATGGGLADAVLSSPAYLAQRKLAGRVSVTDEQVRSLLAALLAEPSRRLPPAVAAAALGVAPSSLRGAIPQAQRLLNLDSFPVLRVDVDGSTAVLDEELLREQFEVTQ